MQAHLTRIAQSDQHAMLSHLIACQKPTREYTSAAHITNKRQLYPRIGVHFFNIYIQMFNKLFKAIGGGGRPRSLCKRKTKKIFLP